MSRIISLFIILLISPVLLLTGLFVFLNDGSPIIFKQKRVGLKNKLFLIYKFRTMKKNTPDIPTHKLDRGIDFNIKIGKFLRKLSIDELPQLINILKGEMNFIGPRPALYLQNDLIEIRTAKGIHLIKPGVTGWAQINGRDELTIKNKIKMDKYYLDNKSFFLDFKIIFFTIFKVLKSEGVK